MDKTEAIIRKEGDKWIIYSKDGKKKLGTFTSEEQAKKRLQQIEFFKHKGGGQLKLDIADALKDIPSV